MSPISFSWNKDIYKEGVKLDMCLSPEFQETVKCPGPLVPHLQKFFSKFLLLFLSFQLLCQILRLSETLKDKYLQFIITFYIFYHLRALLQLFERRPFPSTHSLRDGRRTARGGWPHGCRAGTAGSWGRQSLTARGPAVWHYKAETHLAT